MTKIKVMVEGGKASASPAMSQSLGPMKINIQDVLAKINEKTKDFQGVKVPVEIDVNEKTKEYEITVGSPPASELVKKETGVEKGSGTPDKIKVGNIAIEQLIKVAKMKSTGMFVNDLKASIKTVAGSCNSLGILIEGKNSSEFNKLLDEGKYDKDINEGKTEISAEKKKELEVQLKEVQDRLTAMFAKKKAAEEKEKKEEEKKEEVKEGEVKEGEEKKEEEKKEEPKKEEKKEVKKK